MFQAKLQTFTESSDRSSGAPRTAALRQKLNSLGLDGFIIPRADEHQGEYVPACDERLAWLTGFTGSAGYAAVLKDKAALLVDGRYTTQGAAQSDTGVFEQVAIHEIGLADWLARNAAKSRITTVAIDAMEFHHPVYVGDIVSCHATLIKVGRTSLRIAVEAWAQRTKGGELVRVTEGVFTYVAIDDAGKTWPVHRA